jgi:hypothetical protein
MFAVALRKNPQNLLIVSAAAYALFVEVQVTLASVDHNHKHYRRLATVFVDNYPG